MLSPVSFGNVSKTYSPEEFQQLISKPQLYAVQNTTVASTPVEENAKPKKNSFKKFILGAIGVAVGAILLAEGAKRGVFKVNPNSNGLVKTVMNTLNTVGSAINNFFSKFTQKAAKEVKEVVDEAPALRNNVKNKLKHLKLSGIEIVGKFRKKAVDTAQEISKGVVENASK